MPEVLTDRLGRYRFVDVTRGRARVLLRREQCSDVFSDRIDVQPGAALTIDLVAPAR